MIKSVAFAIPNFFMNCFKLPVGIIDVLNGLMAKFFRASSDKERGVHWKSWDSLCEEKFEGGWVLRTWNERYFRQSSFMHANLGTNPSFGWRSLLEGRKILTMGIRWRVGDGKEIDIWNDPWIPRTSDFLPRGSESEGIVWLHTNSGVYLTSSGYKSARALKRNGGLRCNPAGESSDRQGVGDVWKNMHNGDMDRIWKEGLQLADDYIRLSTTNLNGGDGVQPEASASKNGDRWTRPQHGYVKINCDAAWNKPGKDGFTWILSRNELGEFEGASFKLLSHEGSPLALEAQAIMLG
ncbi:hypothetical protein LIER_21282 [Lithospermum erythrorhizon]|uniref:Uncharacterized protein n=1 Tax=Lithospermum erythrorhizon TaxID=34254 RepID=A0AAV3QS51_LITER